MIPEMRPRIRLELCWNPAESKILCGGKNALTWIVGRNSHSGRDLELKPQSELHVSWRVDGAEGHAKCSVVRATVGSRKDVTIEGVE